MTFDFELSKVPMSDLAVDPVQLEQTLSTRLRSCRLVFEILDEPTIAGSLAVVAWLERQASDPDTVERAAWL